MYVIWNAKLGGWLTNSGTYSSEYHEAKQFSRDEAIRACRPHVTREGTKSPVYGWLPIYIKDLEHMAGK